MMTFLLVAALTKIQKATPCLAAVAREHQVLCAASLTHQLGGWRSGSCCSPGSQGKAVMQSAGVHLARLCLLSLSVLLFLYSLVGGSLYFFLTPPFPNSAAKLCMVAVQAASGTGTSFSSALATIFSSVSLRHAPRRPDEHNAERVCKVWEQSRLRLSALLIFMQLIAYYNSRHFFYK